jgi:hypothetical protein
VPVDLFQDSNWGGLVVVLSGHHAENQHREDLHGRKPGRVEIHFKVQNSLTNTLGYIKEDEMLNTIQSKKFILDFHSGVQEDEDVLGCYYVCTDKYLQMFWKYETPPSSGSNSQSVKFKPAAASKENVVKASRKNRDIYIHVHQTAQQMHDIDGQ